MLILKISIIWYYQHILLRYSIVAHFHV
jgi:hypothetical protein